MKIEKIIKENRNSILSVNLEKPGIENQKQISIRGTGFIISNDGKFITNAHVYNQIKEEDLKYLGAFIPGKTDDKKLINYERFSVKLLKIDNENDLALMKIVSDKDFNFIDIKRNEIDPAEGEEIVYIGYPLATEMLRIGFGITITTNRCIVSSVKRRKIDGSLHFFLIDTHTNNGSSGSPVFSIETGNLLGIVSGKISAKVPIPDGKIIDIPSNIGICRPSKYIKNLLK